MIFWTAVAALTVAVLGMICWPLLRARASEDVSTATFDIQVYKSQLAEVDREEKRGSLNAEEAEAARAEIARRLLAADAERQSENAGPTDGKSMMRFAATSVAVFVPIATVAFYLQIGKPDLPNLPYAERGEEVARAQAAQQGPGGLGDAAASLEKRLAENPDNLDGWLLLARTHAATGRFDAAVTAYERALTLDRSAEILSAYGEALVFWGDGQVSESAQKAFLEVLTSQPNDPRARFYLAQADYQAGRPTKALENLVALANSADAAAPWQPAVRDSALRIGAELGDDGVEARLPALPAAGTAVASAPAPQVDAETMAAAENMSPEERQEMIRGMVEGLAERLKDNPQDFDGWMRLIRSLAVLGDSENAQMALEEALGIFDRAPFPKRQLAGLADELGLALPGAAEGLSGPTAEDVAAAGEMTPEDRQEMIRGMVDGLAEKLKDEPQNFDGWIRLIRSYVVLGETGKAQTALEEALAIFDRAPFPKRQLAGLASELGLALPTAAAGQPGPSAEDVAAAGEMSPEERMEMITGMVDGLAERLKDNPDDLEGWSRLATSYSVLNRREEALNAFDRAIALAPQDSGLLIQKARAIRAFAGDRPTPESAALMEQVLTLDPKSIEALWFTALSAVGKGDKTRARTLFDRALAELPAGSQEHTELKAQAARMLGE